MSQLGYMLKFRLEIMGLETELVALGSGQI